MNLKEMAAERAVGCVQSGMVVGMGTGTTARYFVEMLGQRLLDGRLKNILGVPTSSETERLARHWEIPLTSLREHSLLDLTVDGADEVGPGLVLIKGQGGALLHEKIVARASRQEIIVADEGKLVQILGSRAPVAVEVIPFGWPTYESALRGLGCEPQLRMVDDEPYLTDERNYIVDCHFAQIDDPRGLERELNSITGVVENGLFVGLAHRAFIASPTGVTELSAA
jgi:ribose 5-phosphate isomerase A